MNRQEWPKIDPGRMIHQITILQQSAITGASGPSVAYVPLLTGVWAQVDVFEGTELIRSGQQLSMQPATIRIFWQPGIAAEMQVQLDNGALYIIKSIDNPEERNVVLFLNCVAFGGNDK